MITIKTKQPLKYRHELKYLITSQEGNILSSRLSALFRLDAHAGVDGTYRVSSLYFDTPCEKALRQKIDGVNNREKFRLRFYGEEPTFFRLEKKMKRNGLCAKQSARLTREEAKYLLDGKLDFLIESKDPLLIELYSKLRGDQLRPKTLVIYDREAFVYTPGNVRVTIDRNLRTSLYYTDILDVGHAHFDISEGSPVLEVKYDEFLPEIVKMAVKVDFGRAGAFSKYAASRKYD